MSYPYVVERILDNYPDLEPESVALRLQIASFVSLEKRYLYFQVPKAACSQMKEILRTIEGAPRLRFLPGSVPVTHREMYIHARPNLPLPSLMDLDNSTQREVLESLDFFRMTVVRNPYKRVVSAWRNRVLFCEPIGSEVYKELRGGLPDVHHKSIVSFEEFIAYLENRCDLRTCNDHWSLQADHIFFPALNFDCIGRLAQLGKTLRRFARHLGFSEPFAAQGRNASFPVGRAVYTQELADTVYRLYRRDFEVFGYDRNSWPTGGEKKAAIPEEDFYDEIIERNLVILGLYQEQARLRSQLQRVSRLHLLPLVNALAGCRLALRRAASGIRQRAGGMFRSAGRGRRDSVTSA